MIIHTGMRTDIPAFYADWFANRIREGFGLCAKIPINSIQVTEYSLDPSVVDLIGFCTKKSGTNAKIYGFIATLWHVLVCDNYSLWKEMNRWFRIKRVCYLHFKNCLRS